MFFDRRSIYILMAIMLIWGIMGFATDTGSLLNLLFTIPGVLIAITFHEFAHAWAADKLGDDTPRMEGRLSLNPMAHLDPVGSIMLLFAGFGWGKPVNVNPRNYNRDISMEKADAIVSVAGPVMNFILAIILTIIYCAMQKFGVFATLPPDIGGIIMLIIVYAISINVGLGVFNLIPLPPLDGSKVLFYFLPSKLKPIMYTLERYSFIIILVLFMTDLSSVIIQPAYNLVLNLIMFILKL